MKRKWSHKLVCAGLVLTMLTGLTACSRSADSDSSKNNENANLAKQGVYSEQSLEMPELGDDISIRMLSQQGDRIYALVQIYSWSENSEVNEMKIISWKNDGTDMQMADLQMSMGGADDAAGTEDDQSEDTSAKKEAATEDAVTEDAATDMIVDDMVMDDMSYSNYEYTGLSQCVMTEDGILYAIKDHYKEDYSDPENPISVSEMFVCSWTLDGVMQWEVELEGLQTEESFYYIQSVVPTKDGNITLFLSGDSQEKMTVQADGTVSPREPLSESSSILSNGSSMMMQEDDTLGIIYWNETDNYSMYFATYDPITDTVTQDVKMPDSFSMSGYNAMVPGVGVDLIYSDSNGVYSYNLGDEQPALMMSFINSDMNTTSMYNLLMIDETHIIGFYYDNTTGRTIGSIFTKVNPEDIKDKQVLTVAGNYIDYDLKERVVDFNKNSEDYRIVVKEYYTYNTMEDYMAGYTQLNNDIISGNMPDILIVDANVPLENYVSKGLIADIGALIEKDEELSQVEFMENVFEAYKIDGKLYQVIPSFYVRTMIAKEATVGDRTSWTMQEMQELVASMPEGTQAIGDMTRTGFFYTMMQYSGSDFVDVSTGKCNFNSQGFKDLLTYAAELPEEYDEEYWGDDYWMNYQSQYREDRTILMECYISSARDMVRNINGYFGEDITYIGFPTESGQGSVLAANQSYALSTQSADLDGAWQFIRYYLTDEYQDTLEWTLPITREGFMKNVEEAMENPYYLDENGQKVEYEDTFYINDEEIPLGNMTQEQADEFVSFVESITRKAYYNENIQNIIDEETPAFFEGQKGVDAVADIIQSRVQLYVNENR